MNGGRPQARGRSPQFNSTRFQSRDNRSVATFKLVSLLAVASTGVLLAGAADLWRQERGAVVKAYQAKDYSAMRELLLKQHADFPSVRGPLYNLACAEALLGHTVAALDWLRKFADSGLDQDPRKDPNLASLRDSSEFEAIERQMERNRAPVSKATTFFTFPDENALTEDLAYDPRTRTFYASSVHLSKIFAIDRAGKLRDFIGEGQDGVWSVLALSVDAKRRILWASTAAMPNAAAYRKEDENRSAMLRYDLETGRLVKRYELQRDGKAHVLGDMTLSPSGDVYVSDSVDGTVYTIHPSKDELEVLVTKGNFASPQTPALAPDGKRLLVADYSLGIAIVELKSGSIGWLELPADLALTGIDGLYVVPGGLIAVQNGTHPERVIRIWTDAAYTKAVRWETIEKGTPELGDPTHGILVGKQFYYIANSGWERFNDDGSINPKAPASPPIIRRFTLE
jgi:hypothetical protein